MRAQEVNCIEEDEIDLRELFATIWKYKKFIIIFVFIVVSITLFMVITMPNVYKSEIVLTPQIKSKNIGGGLSSLAAMAGINIGGSDGNDPYIVMETILKDNDFYKEVIEKYNLIDKMKVMKNAVYPFGLSFEEKKKESKKRNHEEEIFDLTKKLKGVVKISQDKKSSLITLSATYVDRYLANELVQIFLKEIIQRVKQNDLKEMKKQIHYYRKELASTNDVVLKEQLSKSLSALLQKEVFSNANEYYFVSKLIDSHVAYIKDKVKPKRGLILVVSMITSLILSIFIVFFIEFIKNSKDEKNK